MAVQYIAAVHVYSHPDSKTHTQPPRSSYLCWSNVNDNDGLSVCMIPENTLTSKVAAINSAEEIQP